MAAGLTQGPQPTHLTGVIMRKFEAAVIVSGLLLAVACSPTELPDTAVMSPTSTALAKAGPTTHTEYDGGSTDGGTCGNEWANDTYRLDIKVTPNGDGTYRMRTEYKNGEFVTIAGQSPGACEDGSNHGQTVVAGIVGKLEGYLNETITSATFNPKACDVAGSCTTRTDYLMAAFTCPGGACQSDYVYDFKYHSNDKGLIFRHWRDQDHGGGEMFTGDIASQ